MVYLFKEMDDLTTLFYYPEYPDYPHWNIIYPDFSLSISKETQVKAKTFFKSQNCVGHYYSMEELLDKKPVSVDEFFICKKVNQTVQMNEEDLKKYNVQKQSDLGLFSEVVCNCFELTKAAKLQFSQKMEIIRQLTASDFYLFYEDKNLVGAWSTFQTSDQFNFIMNMGILPKHRNKGLSRVMAFFAKEFSDKDLITHSNNQLLRKNVLPKLGFVSEGELFVYEL